MSTIIRTLFQRRRRKGGRKDKFRHIFCCNVLKKICAKYDLKYKVKLIVQTPLGQQALTLRTKKTPYKKKTPP